MARPKKPVDPETVKKLAAIHCSWEEMESILGVSRQTLERRFGHVIEEGRSHGKMSLRRKRYELAMNGNVALIIFLSKVLLGESDREKEAPVPTRFVVVERVDEAGKKIGETHLQTAAN